MRKSIILFISLFLLSCEYVAAGDFSQFTQFASNPVTTATTSWEGYPSHGNIEDGSLIQVGSTIYRFYCAGYPSFNTGYEYISAASYPGGTWTKSANPVVYANQFYSGAGVAACAARVIPMQDGSYRMYLHAFDGTHYDRGYMLTATAGGFPDTWTIGNGGNAIFTESGSGFDSWQIQTQGVVPSWESNDGLWHLFYVGYNQTTFSGGHATSSDGITWSNRSQVMSPSGSSWYATHLIPVGYRKIGSKFYITVDGFGNPTGCSDNSQLWRVGYYETEDLNNLGTVHGPIIEPIPGGWNSCGVEGAELFQETSGRVSITFLGAPTLYNPGGGNGYSSGVALNTSFIPRGVSNFGQGGKLTNLGQGGKIGGF